MLYLSRRFDEAIGQSQKTIEIAPNHFFAHWVLGITYGQGARHEEAIAELSQAATLAGGSLEIKADLGRVYAKMGATDEAREALRQLGARSVEQYVSPVNIAKLHVGLGEIDQAFEWLEKAYEERSIKLPLFTVDPTNIDDLGSDGRLTEMRRRMKFSQ